MNLLKQFWNWFLNPKTDAYCDVEHEPTPVEVEEVEDSRPVGEIFAHICREAGVKQRDLDSTNAVALFEEWYTGAANEEDIKASLAEFRKTNGAINAKFAGKI